MEQEIKKNSVAAWFLAARPKTLSAALVPVVAASALAWSQERFLWMPALLCVAFASLMQIAANFINDLFDFLRGSDREDRLGPERACAQGWISPRAMRWGIALTIVPACVVGLFLLCYGDIWLIAVGAACVVFAFLYTLMLSYCGLGDVLVWLFFGFVPVLGTYYVQAGVLTSEAWWLAAACGMAVDNLLVINNYRDRDADRISGKRTLIVALGEPFGRYLYLLQGIAATLCLLSPSLIHRCHPYSGWVAVYLTLHVLTWHHMSVIRSGKALNQILGETSRNILIFGLSAVATFLFG